MHSCKFSVFSHRVFFGPDENWQKKKAEGGVNVCNRSSWLFTRSFLSPSPRFSLPSLSIFLAPDSRFSVPLELLARAPVGSPPSGPPGCDTATRPSPDRLSCFLSWMIDGRAPRRSLCVVSWCLQKTDHGKSRSSIFHISSFTRRIEMDICSNYPTTPSFHNRREKKKCLTHLSRKSPSWWLYSTGFHNRQHEGCRGNIRWDISEIGAKVRQAPLVHAKCLAPANDFPVVNHLNPACAVFRHATEEQRDLQKPLRS